MTTPFRQIVEAYRAKYGNAPECFLRQTDGSLRDLIILWHDTQPDDWRHLFAADLMAATMPGVLLPEGEIGKAALQGRAG